MSESILIFGLIFFLGHFFTLLFKKTWIPDVLLLMLVASFWVRYCILFLP